MIFKSPYTTFVVFQCCLKRPGLDIVHCDFGVVATGYNFVGIEFHTGYNMSVMCSEGKMQRLLILPHLVLFTRAQ
jgi:hypothetical protein